MLGSFSFISYFLNKIKIQDKYPGLTYKWWPVRDSNPWMHAWKACELTVSPTGHGAWSRTRTYDRSVNSRLLYQLSYSSNGAGDGNRTHVVSLEGWSSTIELHPHCLLSRGPNDYCLSIITLIKYDCK